MVSSQSSGQELKSEGVQAGGTLTSSSSKSSGTTTRSSNKEHFHHVLTSAKSVDYGDMDAVCIFIFIEEML